MLQQYNPDILHFSGHGSPNGLLLEDITGGGKLISADVLEGVFKTLNTCTKLVVLNSCYAENQARAIATSVDCVIGMSSTVEDPAAISFAVGFYEALAFGRDVQTAFELGRHQVAIVRLAGNSGRIWSRDLPSKTSIPFIAHSKKLASRQYLRPISTIFYTTSTA